MLFYNFWRKFEKNVKGLVSPYFFRIFGQNLMKYKGVSPCFFIIFGQNSKKCKGVSPYFFRIFAKI